MQRLPAQVRAEHDHVDRVGRQEREPRGIACDAAREVEHDLVREGGRDEADTERGSVRLPRGHRDGAQVEEVHEVRVRAEARVDGDRLGGDLGERRVLGGRRQQQRVDPAACVARGVEHRAGGDAQALEQRAVLHQPVRGDPEGRSHDARDRGIQVRRVREHVRPGRLAALRHERALVEEERGAEEGTEVDGLDDGARVAHPLDRGRERRAGAGREGREVAVGGDADHGDAARREARGGRPVAAGGIRRVGPDHNGERALRGREVRGEHAHGVVGAAGGHDARGGHEAERGLDPDEAVQGGGHAAGSRGVGAERHVDEAERDGGRRARAGSARDAVGPGRVPHGAVGAAGADETGGELVEVGLAEHERAGLPQARDGGRVDLGRRGGGRARGRRGHPGDVDVVLHRDEPAR
ncbi:hypothetical protein DOU02_08335 [Clavibacter michiganensis subsp. michiganensis]|nr:hypothetical protein DOU02_08335 [Clavibacter michiganensis subsp. michiganensis]